MKKFVFATILAALFVVPCTAQKKGENYIAFSVKADVGFGGSKVQTGDLTIDEGNFLEPGFSMWVEYGRFLIDNLRLGIMTGYSFSASGLVQNDDKWYGSRYNMFNLVPNVSYYVKITKFLYYTPEVGFGAVFGRYSEDLTPLTKIKYPAAGLSFFLQPALFECRVNNTWAMGFGVGSITCEYTTFFDKPDDTKFHQSTFGLNLTGNFCVKAYF